MSGARDGSAVPLGPPINADRRLRGPYTAAGALAGLLVPVALDRWPELVAAHDIELRAVAPDLQHLVPARRQSVAASIPRAERILVPAPQRTLRIANGLAEFVAEHLGRLGGGPYGLTVCNLDRADAADRELLQVLARRIEPSLLMVTVQPDGPDEVVDAGEPGQIGPRLGAVLHLLGNSPDPAEAAEALLFATGWCLENGCHDAAAELGLRGLTFARPEHDPETWWELVHDTTMALAALGREAESEAVLHRARAATVSPVWHSTIAYSLAMLRTRHQDPAQRDLDAALGWINTGIALCGLLPDPASRAVKLGFDLNGKALIESRRGNVEEALRLVQEAIDLADRDLDPGVQPIHRLVLRANRAQLRIMLGDHLAALADLDAVIAADPGYPDYYLDRGNLLHRLGRDEDAVADYETALKVGLPFPEPYYNRAEIRFAHGDLEGARADLDRVLVLDPGFLDALVNRSGLLVALEDYDGARADVAAGLARQPANPYLLCTLGQIEMAAGRRSQAREAFDAALEAAPDLAVAWASRGVLAFESGDAEAAIADLTQALLLGEDPAVLFNRALALRDAGRQAEAKADLTRARELAPNDPDIAQALAV